MLRVLLVNIFILGAAGIVLCQAPPDTASQAPEMAPGGKPVTLIAIPQDEFFRVLPAPGQFLVNQTTTQFQINYLTGGTNNFGDTCTSWPAQAKTAFDYAASLWASSLQSNVPITINACWATSLEADVLGYSGPRTYNRNFTGAPRTDTWYPVALANALHGSDLDALAPDMDMAFSSTYSWYLGTDGHPGSGRYDFVSVVMHEIGHGLGFIGSMDVANGRGSWGWRGGSAYPVIYDRFTENGSGQSLINTSIFPNPSTALAAQLTGGDLYFDGTKANAANGGGRVKIYAPSTWYKDSSYAHLDYNTYKNTINALMVYAMPSATARHVPGPVTLSIFQDLGWTTSGGSTCTLPAPTLIAPSGTVSSTPTYSWYAVSGAEQYQLYVTDSATSGKINTWYKASDIGCSSGTCSVKPSTALAAGSANFWVRAWSSCNTSTYGNWSSAKNFTVSAGGGTVSGKILSLYTVSGATVGGSATLWAQVQNTGSAGFPSNTVVYFYVGGLSNPWVGSTSVAGLGAGATQWYYLDWTIGSTVEPGTHTYWAQLWYSGSAVSDWSSGQSFTISGGSSTASASIVSLYPVSGATVGGVATLWAQVKNTGTAALPSTAIVWFYVSNISDNWVGSASVAGLGAGATQWYYYSWTIPSSASAGTHTYWARVYNGSTAISNWSSGQNFAISSGSSASASVLNLYTVTGATIGGTAKLWAQVKNIGSTALPGDSVVWFWVSSLSSNWVGYASTAGLTAGNSAWYSYTWGIPSILTAGTYYYYARVYSGNTPLSDWSSSQSFTISSGVGSTTGFNEQFNGTSAPNWTAHNGTWNVSGGCYYAAGTGIADMFGAAGHNIADFSNLDYTIMISRVEASTNKYRNSSGIFIRASGGFVDVSTFPIQGQHPDVNDISIMRYHVGD